MSWLEQNPIAVGAGLMFGATLTFRFTNYALASLDQAMRGWFVGRALGKAGCSYEEIRDHAPRVASPMSFMGRCHPTCVACATLGYPPLPVSPYGIEINKPDEPTS